MAITAVFVSPALYDHPPPTTPTWTGLIPAQGGNADFFDGGNYRIVGTVKEKGTPDAPLHRRVLLCDQLSGRVVRSAWSDPVTGAYAFEHIRLGTFYVIAFDYAGTYRAVIADNQTPELMT